MDMFNIPLILLGIVVVAAIFIAYRVKSRASAFFGAAYPNARYSAMGNEFVTRQGLSRVLTSKGLQEAVSAATSRDFPFQESDIDSLDRELGTIMVGVIEMVKDEMPAPSRPLFDTFLLRHEILTLKRILRAMFHEKEWQADPVGGLDRKTLQLLKEAEGLSDIPYILRYTPYKEVMEKAFEEGIPEPGEPDSALDKFYFNQMGETIEGLKVWKRPYHEYLSFYSDIQNIKLALRLREMGEELETRHLILAGKGLGEWELLQMAASESLEEALRQLQGTPYEMVAEDIFAAERGLDRRLLKFTYELALRYINTAGPSLHFAQAREFEISNLRKIFRGLGEGVSPGEIEKELVVIE